MLCVGWNVRDRWEVIDHLVLATSSQHPSNLITSAAMIHSQPSNYPSGAEDSPLYNEETFSEDVDLEGSVVSDQVETPCLQTIRIPPRIRAPPSPCPSISTTTSELEVEQGEALLKVKRGWVKEEFLDPEVILSNRGNRLVPKKRRKSSMGTKDGKTRGKKQGMKTPLIGHFSEKKKLAAGKVAKNPDDKANKAKSKGRRKKKSGIQTYSIGVLLI